MEKNIINLYIKNKNLINQVVFIKNYNKLIKIKIKNFKKNLFRIKIIYD